MPGTGQNRHSWDDLRRGSANARTRPSQVRLSELLGWAFAVASKDDGQTRGLIASGLQVGETTVDSWTKPSKQNNAPAWAIAEMIARPELLGTSARMLLVRQLLEPGGLRVYEDVEHVGVTVSIEAEFFDVSSAVGGIAQSIRDAVADGSISDDEREQVLTQIEASIAELHELKAAVGGAS